MRLWKTAEEKRAEKQEREAQEQSKWRYIGTVEGRTVYVDDNREKTGDVSVCYWTLTQRVDGFRKAQKVGEGGCSQHTVEQESTVEAWLAGGPVPNLNRTPCTSSPKPKKPIEGNVIPFQKR